MSWYAKQISCLVKTAISSKYIDQVVKYHETPSDLPFNNIFGDENYRVVIPLSNAALLEITTMLEKGQTKSGSKYKVNLDNKTVSKVVVQEDGSEVLDTRTMRLGKIIKRELGEDYADQWSQQVASGNMFNPNYSIVVSRHPIDVLRMSDYSNIQSCHSEGASYFHCALVEAEEGGPIAYVVRNRDLEDIDINSPEIFYDSDRKNDGGSIVPISRLRMRRFVNDDGYELAMPEVRVYGKKISGFLESLTNWAYEAQKSEFEGKDISMDEFGHIGGSYKDNSDGTLFNNFFDSDDYRGNTKYVGGNEGRAQAAVWEEELRDILERNSELQYSSVSAEVQNDAEEDGGEVYLLFYGSIHFKYEGAVLKDDYSNLSKSYPWKEKYNRKAGTPPVNDWDLTLEVRDIVNDVASDFYFDDLNLNFDESGGLELDCYISPEDIYNPDDVNYVIDQLVRFEDKSYNSVWSIIRENFVKMGILMDHPIDSIVINMPDDAYENFEIIKNDGAFSIVSKPIANSADYVVGETNADQQILNAMYSIMFEEIQSIAQAASKQQYLFPEYYDVKPDFSSLPRPEIRYLVKSEFNGIEYYEFKIEFNFLSRNIPPESSDAFFKYLSIFDRNFNRIIASVHSKMDSIYQQYKLQEAPEAQASTWYRLVRESSTNWYKRAKSYWTQGQVYTDSEGNSYEVDILIDLAKDLKKVKVDVEKLSVQLVDDVWGRGEAYISPEMVMDDPDRDEEFRDHFKDIQDVDITKPILIRKSNGEIIDGYHRLSRAYLEGIEKIPAKIIDEDTLAEARIQDFVEEGK